MPQAQQRRAQITRKRLLDAAVEALVACGYAGATTQEVCRRAGVSRGTLQHHFRTRTALLVAALEYILADRVEAFVQSRSEDGAAAPDELLELMWEQWQGPALSAWLELAVAARTNPELGSAMRGVMLEFDDRIVAAFGQVTDAGPLPPAFRKSGVLFLFAVLNGLAVGRSYEDEGQSQPVLDLLKQLATTMLGGAHE